MSIKKEYLRLGSYTMQGVVDVINNDSAFCYIPKKGASIAIKLDGEYYKYEELKPIKIAPAILLQLGFVLHNGMYKKDRIGIENTIDNDYWNVRNLETEETSFFVKEIRFVHELQNVFLFI